MCFTNLGKCHWIKVYKLPEGGRNSRGRPINNVIQLEEGEKVSAILAVREFPEDQYVFFATAQGMVKKVQPFRLQKRPQSRHQGHRAQRRRLPRRRRANQRLGRHHAVLQLG